MAHTAPPPTKLVIDSTTIYSLLTTLLILLLSYTLSKRLLPRSSTPKTRILFIWHSFDSLIHILLEGSFLYNCFFSSSLLSLSTVSENLNDPSISHPASWSRLTAPGVHFLGDEKRGYGAAYAAPGNLPAKLWMEYAKADRRWGGADLTVVSLELLTVFIGGPLAAYICYLCTQTGKGGNKTVNNQRGVGKRAEEGGMGRVWIWAGWLAVGELYGGFMTFAPEWLSGNVNLDGSNWMYMWVYLTFFNMLWVVMPLWVLWQGYGEIMGAFRVAERVDGESKNRKSR